MSLVTVDPLGAVRSEEPTQVGIMMLLAACSIIPQESDLFRNQDSLISSFCLHRFLLSAFLFFFALFYGFLFFFLSLSF
jgi:hypothetical protein